MIGVGIRACNTSWNRHVDLLVYYRIGDKVFDLRELEPEDFKEIPAGLREPTAAVLDKIAAQQLMDDLWQCGIRPSEGSGSAGALAATERHLADMRKLVFETKG